MVLTVLHIMEHVGKHPETLQEIIDSIVTKDVNDTTVRLLGAS